MTLTVRETEYEVFFAYAGDHGAVTMRLLPERGLWRPDAVFAHRRSPGQRHPGVCEYVADCALEEIDNARALVPAYKWGKRHDREDVARVLRSWYREFVEELDEPVHREPDRPGAEEA